MQNTGIPPQDRRAFLRTAFSAATLPFLARASSQPALVRYPYVQNVRGNRVTLRWTTRDRGVGAVEYWREDGTVRRVPAQAAEFQRTVTGMQYTYYRYQAVIAGLSPGTDYSYRVFVDGENLVPDDELYFRTTCVSAFDFLAIGDSGMGTEGQSRLATRMAREKPKLLIHTGDLVYPTGTYDSYEKRYFDYYRSLMKNVPFFPCPGNHDYYETAALPYLSVHDLPAEQVEERDQGRYYSYDWNNVHFVSLDSNETLEAAVRGRNGMLDWLDRDLGASKKFWRVVFFHHPPYATGLNEGDPLSALVRDAIVPILEKHHVPVALSGHEHSYQRTLPMAGGEVVDSGKGTVYLTTGGGGATLYPVRPARYIAHGASVYHYLRCEVSGAKMTVRAIDSAGDEIDRAVIAPPPVLNRGPVVNSASFERAVAARGLVSIFGHQLAPDDAVLARRPLPRESQGVKVLLDDEPLPLLMVSPTQINAVLPERTGTARLVVVTANGSAETAVAVQDVAPALFSGAVFHSGGRQVSMDAPAMSGEVLSLYATGMGAVEGEAPNDVPPSGHHRVIAPVQVRVAGKMVEPLSAALAEDLVGVYRVTFKLPDVQGDTLSLVLVTGGAPSNEIQIPAAR